MSIERDFGLGIEGDVDRRGEFLDIEGASGEVASADFQGRYLAQTIIGFQDYLFGASSSSMFTLR